MKYVLIGLVAVLGGCEVTIPDWHDTIGAGTRHSVQLTLEGEVLCWGSNEDGQCDDDGETLTQISAGSGYNCGIKTDGNAVCWGEDEGEVVCWGDNQDGQTDVPE